METLRNTKTEENEIFIFIKLHKYDIVLVKLLKKEENEKNTQT